MKCRKLFFIVLLLNLCSCKQQSDIDTKEDQERPNIVVIIGDDIGYSDLGCYGANIQTPNLDRLAYDGLRFKRFYNMAKCNPTRSTMITGLYEGDDRAISFVPLLREAGYSAVMSGKEHFDRWVPKDCYFSNTFEKSFTFWATTEYFVPPDGEFERPFVLNGDTITANQIEAEILPKYKTDFITDYAIKWLDEMMVRDDPFFLLLPYHAAHYPLQARPEDIAKYKGKYMAGWDKLRDERFERMKEIGILDSDCELSPAAGNSNRFRGHPKGFDEIRDKFPTYYPWDSMTEQEKENKDLEMAVYAAIIDRMDQNIGRVINRLEQEDELENTLILYFTDNGACPFDSNVDFDIPPGPAEGYRCQSPVWGNLSNTPFRLYKQNGHEGGANTHFIAHWPKVIAKNQITDQVGHVADLFPTFLEMANVNYPQSYNGKQTHDLDGQSLMPIFHGRERTQTEHIVSGFTERFRMYLNGDYKLVRENGDDWELYNLKKDNVENHNLAESMPDKLSEMINLYEEYKSETNEAN